MAALRRSPLSSRQFHAELLGEGGGFSVRMPSGRRPHQGWMVAVAGHEQVYPDRSFQPSDVTEYRHRHYRHLQQAGGRYFGGWHDREAHKAYLDEAERHFGTQTALRRAAEEHQKAIYNVGTGQTIHTAGPGSLGHVETVPRALRGRRH